MTSPTTRARLHVAPIGPQAHLGHLVQDAALHRLQPVAGIRECARVDDGIRVFEERALHLGGDIDVLDPLARGLRRAAVTGAIASRVGAGVVEE